MARSSLITSAALAAVAAAAALAVPAHAQEAPAQADVQLAQADDSGRHGGWRNGGTGGDVDRSAARSEARQQRSEARAEWQQQRAQARTEQAPQQRSAPDGGWGSQRPAEGTRYGRDWSNGGTVSRPAPAYRGATPQVPERQADAQRTWRGRDGSATTGSGQRNRTYSDANRDRTYGGDRTQTYREGYRDGRTADSWRDRTGQQQQAYRQGYSSGTRDWSRNRYSSTSRQWDRNDWRRDNRYNWYGYRSQHRDLYRAGRYYSPYRNWSYSRLSIGFFLEPLFYGNNYWINDPWQYRLPEVYGPYRWVRYYDDVLLVDIYTGEVVDVIYDFFW